MLLADHQSNETERRVATEWAANLWKAGAPITVVRSTLTPPPEPPRFVTFCVEDEAPSTDDVWTARVSVAVVAFMAFYMAAHFIAAWAAGRL